MRQRTTLALSFLITLALGSGAWEVGATPQEQQRSEKKNEKKRVKATLTEPATRPTAVPDAPADTEETPPSPSEATGQVEADAAEATTSRASEAAPAAAADRQPTSTERPATAPAAVENDAAGRDASFQERIEVIEVLLDAVVTDGDQQVTGLGPQDFVVEEEGRPVQVTSATFYGSPEQLQASGEGEVERSDRYFIFFFHDRSRDATFIRPLLLDAGKQARKWVEEERLPNDQVAVVMHDVRLKVYTDFTRDAGQITDAITRAVAAKKEPDRAAGRSKEPLRRDADSPSLLLNLPAGSDLGRESRVFEKAVALLGRAAEGIVGRKNLVLFSVGFGDVDTGGFWTPDVRYYPALEQNLNDGNVAVYSIDLVGARRGSPAGPGISSSLSSVAADTAGEYFETFTNFLTPLKQISEDTAGYYLLSYKSEYARGTSGYREVKVDTVEKRYDVRARKGYMYGDEDKPLRMPDQPEEDDESPSREPETGRGGGAGR